MGYRVAESTQEVEGHVYLENFARPQVGPLRGEREIPELVMYMAIPQVFYTLSAGRSWPSPEKR